MPKYQMLAEWLQQKIAEGVYQPGKKLPSEQELQAQFSVSRQTVRRALGVLERQGFVRSRQGSGTFVTDAEAEEKSRSRRIAVVTTYVDNYIFPRIIRGIEKVLSDQGFQVQIAFTNNRIWREEAVLADLLKQDLGGLIIETTRSALPNPNLALYRELQSRKIPILFLNSSYPELTCPMVALQDEMAGRCAAQYLIEHGHRKLGGLFKRDDGQGIRRYRGFMEAVRDAGIRPCEDGILWFDTEDTLAFGRLEQAVAERLGSCTGVLCYNDSAAFEVMEIWKRHGISVPGDVSVVSVDNTDLAVLGEVGLTSVHHPKEALGEKAAEMLLSMIRTGIPGCTYEFEARLVERDSVKKIGGTTEL